MVGTIGFAGSKARAQGTLVTWTREIGGIHLVMSLLGGAILGLVFTLLGSAVGALASRLAVRSVAVAVLICLAIVDAVGLPATFLSRARQVPLSWKHVFPPSMSSGLYGFTLGTGIMTAIYFWSFPALLVGIMLAAKVSTGVLAGSSFGLGRALPTILSVAAENEDVLDRWEENYRRLGTRFRWIGGLVSAAAVALVARVAWRSL